MLKSAATWEDARLGDPAPPLDDQDVHIWLLSLDGSLALGNGVGVLSAEERDRAARFVFERDRRRFEIGRMAQRAVLATYAGVRPADIQYQASENGKLSLTVPRNPGLEFSLSRSHDHAILAVTRGDPVGVDVERIDPNRDLRLVAESHFSEREQEALKAVDGDAWSRRFFHIWTAKEAIVKALGDGLILPLQRFTVNADPDAPPGMLDDAADPSAATTWTLKNFALGKEYWGCIAIKRPSVRERLFRLVA